MYVRLKFDLPIVNYYYLPISLMTLTPNLRHSVNFFTARIYASTLDNFGFSSLSLLAKWERIAWPIRSVPNVPRTALAHKQPPYMAPVTEGKKASDPAR